MKDKNGDDLVVGDRVMWRPTYRRDWIRGTIRKFSTRGAGAMIDDGDHDNADLHTNGFSISEWIEKSAQIRKATP